MAMVIAMEWNGHGMNPSRYVFPFRGKHTDGQEGPSGLRSHLDDGWWVQKVCCVFFLTRTLPRDKVRKEGGVGGQEGGAYYLRKCAPLPMRHFLCF